MAKHTFTVEVETDEADALAATEAMRHALAESIWDEFRPGRVLRGEAPVTGIRIDGRQYDFVAGKLEATPINADIARMIVENRIIPAIKALRENNPGMRLAEAKKLVDNWKASR